MNRPCSRCDVCQGYSWRVTAVPCVDTFPDALGVCVGCLKEMAERSGGIAYVANDRLLVSIPTLEIYLPQDPEAK